MRRREVVAALGSVAAWPLSASAQDRKTPAQPAERGMRRIGILTGAPVMSPQIIGLREALVSALRERGWDEGRNLAIESRAAEGRPERFPEVAAELVALNVDVIVAPNSQSVSAAMGKSRTIPIVMIDVSHPVEAGFIASLARPGGNVTGLTNQGKDIVNKHIDLLREIGPGLDKVALIFSPSNAGSAIGMREQEAEVRRLGLTFLAVPIDSAADIEPAFAMLARERPQALHIHGTPIAVIHRARILALATEHRLPTATLFRAFALDGALIAYGPNQIESWRRAATYVDRILKGANPGDLPVEQPTKFDLIINLKTANALGLTIPPTLLASADEVIE